MIFGMVPRFTAKLLLVPRRRAPASFLWGLGVGTIAGIALAEGVVRRLAQHPKAEPVEHAVDGVRGAQKVEAQSAAP